MPTARRARAVTPKTHVSGAKPKRRAGAVTPGARVSRAKPKRRAGTASVPVQRAALARRARAAKKQVAARAATRRARLVAGGLGITGIHVSFTSHRPEEVRRFFLESLALGDHAEDEGLGYLMVRAAAGATLGFGRALPGPPEAWRPPREPMLVLEVADVDRAHRLLSARGVTFLAPPADMPWGQRVAMLRDPEGRTMCFAQPIPRRTRPRA